MPNDIEELRLHLFDEIRALRTNAAPTDADLNRAKAVNALAQTVVDSARVEVEASKLKVAGPSKFLAAPDSTTTPTLTGEKTVTTFPGGRVVQHKLG